MNNRLLRQRFLEIYDGSVTYDQRTYDGGSELVLVVKRRLRVLRRGEEEQLGREERFCNGVRAVTLGEGTRDEEESAVLRKWWLGRCEGAPHKEEGAAPLTLTTQHLQASNLSRVSLLQYLVPHLPKLRVVNSIIPRHSFPKLIVVR